MTDQSMGRRIKARREELGLTQQDLSLATGLSTSYISAIERGARLVDSATTLADIAQALRLSDIAQLTGAYRFTVGDTEDGNRIDHPAITELAAMLRRPVLVPRVTAEPLPTVADLQARIGAAWTTWNTSGRFYSETAHLLPGLLGDAHRVLRAATDPLPRLEWAALSEVYAIARHWLRKVGDYGLADIAAERSLAAAQAADDPLLIAFSAWNLVGNHNAAGRYEASVDVAMDGITVLDQAMPTVPTPTRRKSLESMRGSLLLYAAVGSARMDDPDRAWQQWEAADRIARELGPRWFDPRTTFGQPNVSLYQVGLHVETGRNREATELAERLDLDGMPSVERRARHLIDVARAFGRRGEDTAAVAVLLQAERQSPEEVCYSGYARELTRSLVRRGRNMARTDLGALAARMRITV